jgi:hypothetical protein
MVEVAKKEEVIPERVNTWHEIHLDWYDDFSDVLSFAKSRCRSELYSDGEKVGQIVNTVHGFYITEEQLDDFGGVHGADFHDMLKRIEWLIIISKMRKPFHQLPLVKYDGLQVEHWRMGPVFCALNSWDVMDVALKLAISIRRANLNDGSLFVFQSRRPWRIMHSDNDSRIYFLDVRFGFGFVPSFNQVPHEEVTLPFVLP